MSEGSKDSPHGKIPYGERQQRNLLGGVELPSRRKPRHPGPDISRRVSFFDNPPQIVRQPEPVISVKNETPAIKGGAEYFGTREFPTDVWAWRGVAYYERLEDIPTVLRPKTNTPPRIDKLEDCAAVALQVCPPLEGEPSDASFKLVGERGLYVRVILGEKEEVVGGVTVKRPMIRWMHFNEEDAKPKEIRFT